MPSCASLRSRSAAAADRLAAAAVLAAAVAAVAVAAPARAQTMDAPDFRAELLGQSIAYARMNGVVPPWSR